MSKPRRTQKKQEAQEEQKQLEALEELKELQEQELQKTLKENIGGTLKTPLGPAIIQKDNLPEKIYIDDSKLSDTFKTFWEQLQEGLYKQVVEYTDNPDMEKITAVFPDAIEWTREGGANKALFVLVALTAVLYYIDTLPEYLEANGIKKSLAYFAEHINPETGETLLQDFLTFKEDESLKRQLEQEPLIELMARRPKDLPIAVDKLNRNFWGIGDLPASGIFDGKINTKPDNPKKPRVYYMFDARTALARYPDLAAEITEYDESVLGGVAAILDLGQHYMTADEIYYSMGYTGTPGRADRKKIDDAFNKFTSRFVINNKAEREAGLKYKKFEYDGDFLPFERVKGVRINGKDIDTAYHVYDYPAILRFAKDRDQLPRIPLEVKQITLNRTPFINKIEKYLINRVLNAKDGILSERILWAALYEECGASERKQRLRARKYAGELLDHYTAIKWIKGYKTDEKGITLEVTKKKKNGKGKNSGKPRRIQG